MARFGGGLLARAGSWIINPAAAIIYERVRLDGFTESNGAASVAFGDTEFYSTRLSGSLTLTHAPDDPTAWRTVLRASIEHDITDDDLIIRMGPNAQSLGFVTAPRPDPTFGYLSAQFIKPLSEVSSFALSGSSVVGLDKSLGFTGTATYKMKF
jgi:outer membrane lipase/esterase